jgi:hypothetical protein
VVFDSPRNYTLDSVVFITTGSGGDILDTQEVSIKVEYNTVVRTGRSTYNVKVDNKEFLWARDMQKDSLSSNRGIIITLNLPDGMEKGDHTVSAQWGPDYYHEMTSLGLLIAVFSLGITGIALLLVYRRISTYTPCLVIDTDEREYSLFGDNDDISELYLSISRITIPKMKGAEMRKKERPGITKGEALVSKDEAEQIGKDLKKRPGGSGKMIVHQCPECMGTELYYETGFLTGYKYHCKNCDYVGSFVIEKQVDFDQ